MDGATMYFTNGSISDLGILNNNVFEIKNIKFVQGGFNNAN